MKKSIVLITLLFVVCMSGFSQTGIYAGSLYKTPMRDKGLVVQPEIGFNVRSVINGYDYPNLVIYGNAGSQITRQFYLGGGIGLSMLFDRDYFGHYYVSPTFLLYGSGRAYFSPKTTAAFVEMKLGFQIIKTWNTSNTSNTVTSSSQLKFLMMPAIGYDFNNFDIKVSMLNLSGIYFTIGYNFGIMKKW